MLRSLCIALLLVSACGKKDEPKPDDKAETKADKKAEPKTDKADKPDKVEKPVDEPKVDTKDETKPDKPDKPDKKDELATGDYEKRAGALIGKATALFVKLPTDGKDCDKTAATIDKFIDENKAADDIVEAYEKTHPEAKQQFEDKHKDEIEKFQSLAKAVIEPCEENPAMIAVVRKLSPED